MAYDIDQGTTDIDQDTSTALATLSTPTVPAELSRAEGQQVAALIAKSKAPNTQAAYQSDLRQVAAWLLSAKPDLAASVVRLGKRKTPGLCGPLPVATVLAYIAANQDRLAYPSLRRHLASLSVFHKLKGYQNPCSDELVKATMSGLRRDQDHRPKRATALRLSDLKQIIYKLTFVKTLAAKRNIALVLVGWAGALRRSELAALTWGDVVNVEHGIELRLRQAKTDTNSEGQLVALPLAAQAWLCPVRNLEAWQSKCMAMGLDLSTPEGKATPVFCPITQSDKPKLGRRLSGKAIGEIVKVSAASAGYDWDQFTAHSLRAGLITEAHESGKNEADIMATSRHTSTEVFRTYIRSSDAMAKAASKGLL